MAAIQIGNLSGFDAKKPLHAYLIVSPVLREAREYASLLCEALLCETPNADGSPCGSCAACKKVLAGTHPDVSMLGKNKVSVDDVRAMRDSVYLSPNEAARRVVILESVDNFNAASLNALLKILEEPPEGRIFLLTAASKSAVLPTVLSRVCVLAPSRSGFAENPKELFPTASDAACAALRLYLETYEDTDVSALVPETLEKAFSLAYGFYKGENTAFIPLLPKKREDISLYFRVFMLIAGDVCAYKLSAGRVRKERAESDAYGIYREDFRKVCARLSVKRAMSYYEIFEKAYLMTEDYANLNALEAYLTQKL